MAQFFNADFEKGRLYSLRVSPVQSTSFRWSNSKECRDFPDGGHTCIVLAESFDEAYRAVKQKHETTAT